MSNKTIIYGGSGGIGFAVATLLTRQGKDVHLVARDEARLIRCADQLDCSYTIGDVTDSDLFDRTMEDAGDSIAGLVYSVGTINLKSLKRLTEDDFLYDFRVNVLGAALAIRSAVSALRKYSGTSSVVLFSSIAASQGFSLHASTGTVKGAVNGLVLSLAAELAPSIRVNAIAPTLTKTPLASGILANEKMAEALAKQHPMNRLGEKEDVARYAAFLLSDDSDYITGQILGVDGGRSTLR